MWRIRSGSGGVEMDDLRSALCWARLTLIDIHPNLDTGGASSCKQATLHSLCGCGEAFDSVPRDVIW